MSKEVSPLIFSSSNTVADGRLESWKGIAVYLKREIRTVQRWEKEENLPVRRHLHSKQGTVYAYKTELDAWLAQRQPEVKSKSHAPARVMLAVLPFENLSGDPAQDYFSDGLTEEMIARLGGLQPEKLGVIAWTSARTYKNSFKTAAEIGRELGVDYLVEGSVRREGSRARVSAQLIRADDQTHKWAETYEHDLSSIFAVHRQVAREVAREIRLTLSPGEKVELAKIDVVQPDAYEAYLLGRQEFNRWSPQGFTKAAEYFEKAIQKDPGYALPHAWLALCYACLAFFEYLSPREAYPKLRAVALRALEIDSSAVEAHLALAWAHFAYDWNWNAARRGFQQAVRSNPNSFMVHWLYAWFLTSMGEQDQARTEICRALELDPFNPYVNTSFGDMLDLWRRHEDAIAQYQKTLERVPGFGWPYHLMADVYARQKRFDDALAAERKYVALSVDDPDVLQSLEQAYATSGDEGYWTWQLKRLSDQARRTGRTPSAQLAIVHAQLGGRDAAFECLEKAYFDRASPLILLNVNPGWDPVRDDLRFKNLVRRLNFPQ
jgi:TolB-like protein/tetratricopeptide (TPR) repeat protein